MTETTKAEGAARWPVESAWGWWASPAECRGWLGITAGQYVRRLIDGELWRSRFTTHAEWARDVRAGEFRTIGRIYRAARPPRKRGLR